jgi:toxin ParE1/3/4
MRLFLSGRAQSDMDEIWAYIASDQGRIEAADRVLDSISRILHLLSRNPYLGRSRDSDLRPGLRSYPISNYVIFYRIDHDVLCIVRVLHGSRNIRPILGER